MRPTSSPSDCAWLSRSFVPSLCGCVLGCPSQSPPYMMTAGRLPGLVANPRAAEDLNLSISRSGVVLGTHSDSGHGHSFLDDVSQIVVPFGPISVGRDQHRHLGVVEDVVRDRAEHG